jgi:hypothetical protein
MRDSGLAHALLNIGTRDMLLGHPVLNPAIGGRPKQLRNRQCRTGQQPLPAGQTRSGQAGRFDVGGNAPPPSLLYAKNEK